MIACRLLVLLALTLPLLGCPSSNGGSGGGSSTLAITTTTAPYGVVGNSYSATLSASGGTAPFTWTLFGGTLPTGLSLNTSAGTVTGTVAASAVNSTATFTVRDSTGKTATGPVQFSIHPRTDRVSIDGSGAAGNGASTEAVINSTDGRFIVFTSLASSLLALQGGSGSQIFAHDRQTGLPTLISADNLGNAGNGASSQPAISSDCCFVAFTSASTNLAPTPNGSGTQIFFHDAQTNQTTLISRDTFGNAGNGASSQPAMNSDGRFIAFTSSATNLASVVGGSGTQIFLRDTQTNQTTLVSRDTLGNAGNGASSEPAISSDGRFVAFTSAATNLASVVGGSGTQIILRDTTGNATTLVSRDTLGNAGNGASSQPAISSDGRFAAFTSAASNLASIVGGSGTQIILRDTVGNTTIVASQDTLGNAGNGASSNPAISSSGQFVTFASQAVNLATLSGGSGSQIFLRDTVGNQTSLVSEDNSAPPNAGNGASSAPSITGNGAFVAFSSLAVNLTPGANAASQIYVRAIP